MKLCDNRTGRWLGVALAVAQAVGLGACLVAAGPALAQSAAASAAAKKPQLTREELRQCMSSALRLKGQRAELAQADATLSSEEAAIQREGDALKQMLETLDRTSAEAVAAYNARAAERDRQVDQYNAKVAAWRTQSAALTAADKAYTEACAGREFDERDEQAILRGK